MFLRKIFYLLGILFFISQNKLALAEFDTRYELKEQCRKKVVPLIEGDAFKAIEDLGQEYRTKIELLPTFGTRLEYYYEDLIEGSKTINVHNRSKYQEFLQRWKKEIPNSMTRELVMALAFHSYAWEARGGRFASEVSESSFQDFKENLKHAWEILLTLDKRGFNDPNLYATMLRVGTGYNIGGKTLDELFNKGVKIYPGYSMLYGARVNALLPRWGGSVRQVQDFMSNSANATKSKYGDMIYAQLASIVAYTEKENLALNYSLSWDRVEKGCLEMFEKFPQLEYKQNQCAYTASMGEQKELSKEFFSKITRSWDKDMDYVWGKREKYEKWRAWATEGKSSPVGGPIIAAVQKGDTAEIIKLITSGQNVDELDGDGNTPLFLAIKNRDLLSAETLIKLGANLNIHNLKGDYLVHIATASNNFIALKFLIDRGIKLDNENYYGETALHIASKKGFLELVQLFLSKNLIDVNFKDAKGRTALHLAADNSHLPVIEFLLTQPGIEINALDQWHWTPLHYASRNNSEEIVFALLTHGADKDIKTARGETALMIAEKKMQSNIIKLLKRLQRD